MTPRTLIPLVPALRRLRSYWDMMISTVGGALGAYTSTDPRNKITQGFRPRGGTSNEVLGGNLYLLRAQCRQLERTNAEARAAVEGWVANVVGTGIDLIPDTGNPAHDKLILAEWKRYTADCGTNGEDLYHLQRMAVREMVVAGEWLWRYVTLPEIARTGEVPIRILPLEAEWIADSSTGYGVIQSGAGGSCVGGIDFDVLARPIRFHLRNPEAMAGGEAEAVPASQINHGFERRRALQCRGEPVLAPVIETLFQERDLVRAELTSAQNTAAYSVFITSNAHPPPGTDVNGDATTEIPVGAVVRGYPGEDVKMLSHTRPSQQIAPFRQMLRGDIAAAMRLGQRWLDRDYSRFNYSSARGDQQDTDRLLAPVREDVGHLMCGKTYRAVLPYLAMRAGIPTPRPNYRLVPDEVPYVNPVDDIKASLMAIAGGLSTREKEIGRRGGNWKEVFHQLVVEEAEADEHGLSFAPTPGASGAAPAAAPVDTPDQTDTTDQTDAGDDAGNNPSPAQPVDRSIHLTMPDRNRPTRMTIECDADGNPVALVSTDA